MTDQPTLLSDPATGELTRARHNLAVLERLPDLTPGSLTDDDTIALARWAGWGPMAKAFDRHVDNESWKAIGQRLQGILTPQEFASGRAAITTAYYTSVEVMEAMWRIATNLGIDDGARILEPGCGSGRFLIASPFTDLSNAMGIEADPISARIAQLLNPDAQIVTTQLEDLVLRDEQFDLAIGNVPFSENVPFDKAHPGHGFSLHNYFLWRALRALRPGGFLIAITSRYTLDGNAGNAMGPRGELARFGEFVGAARLPSNTFKAAGTSVITDLVVLRRRLDVLDHAPDPETNPWLLTELVSGSSTWQQVAMNRYYHLNPDQVCGDVGIGRGQHHRDELTVTPNGDSDVQLAHAAVNIIRAGQRLAPLDLAGLEAPEPIQLVTEDGRKEGSFHFDEDGGIVQIQGGDPIPVKKSKELGTLIVLRNAVLDLLDAEADPERTDEQLIFPRLLLNRLYEKYVEKFGPVNRCKIIERGVDEETGVPKLVRQRPTMGGFRADPDYVTVLAIEDYDDDTGEGKKGPIFRQRVNRPKRLVERVNTAIEAIAVSMDRTGRVSLPLIAGLLGIPVDEVPDAIDGHAFFDPEQKFWVTADEYLSGNVRRKLAAAREAAKEDPRTFHGNVAKLTEIQPEDLLPNEISAQLGSPWVPVDVVKLFVSELMEAHATYLTVTHEKVTATWSVEVPGHLRTRASHWSSPRVDAFRLIELALNNDKPVVYDKIDDKKVKNQEETLIACEKQSEIVERFRQWVWEDDERAERLARIYNDMFNSTVLRHFTGEGLTFPQMIDGFDPYDHQREMVARALGTPATACGYAVGAGKTAIMGLTAAKLRETGLASKPAAVVPNHLLEQVSREIKALLPNCRLLMASSEDMKKEKRKLFAAKVATGDWDLIVMTHSAFTALPVSPNTHREYLADAIADYQEALHRIDRDSSQGRPGGAKTVKQIEKAIERWENQMKELLHKRVDDGVSWEQLGIDYVMIDEAHYFKNLGFPTRASYAPPASKRAQDLAMKLWWLRRNNSRVGMLLSATLVSNTLAEMYVMQSYLQPDRLDELDVGAFDAWAGTFIEDETKIEVSPDGGSFRMHTRPSKFVNVPELRRMFGEVADIRSRDDLGLAGPDVESENVIIPPSPELTEFVNELVERSDAIRGGGVDPTEDNMLLVCTDGRRAALDLALVGIECDDPGKIGKVIERVATAYHETKNNTYRTTTGDESPVRGALQVVFCDLGTPNAEKGTQVYGKIRRGLIDEGVPAERVRFIHDAKTDNAKAALFAECRAGRVSVLIGSTDKLGVGTNIQHRMTHLHHVDAPWRPADVEQRVGRGQRPGNQNPVLNVIRYVRERSFDAYMWQGLERKARFIAQVLSGRLEAREVEDVGDSTLSFAEVKALATGNPLVMEHAEVSATVARLQRAAAGHSYMMRRMERQAATADSNADANRRTAARLTRLANAIDGDEGFLPLRSRFRVTAEDEVEDEPVIDHKELGKIIGGFVFDQIGSTNPERTIGTYRGITLRVKVIGGFFEDHKAWISAELDRDESVKLFDIDIRGWLKDGQWWRLGAELDNALTASNLTERVDDAMERAARLDAEAVRLRGQRIPFAQENELTEATIRLRQIDQAMADAMGVDDAAA